jgi:hypothetical protein
MTGGSNFYSYYFKKSKKTPIINVEGNASNTRSDTHSSTHSI